MKEMNNIAELIKLKDGKLKDSVQAWIWAVSANFDGNIKDANLEIDKEAPFVSADLGNCKMECHNFQEQLKTYVKTCIEGPGALNEIQEALSKLMDKIKGK